MPSESYKHNKYYQRMSLKPMEHSQPKSPRIEHYMLDDVIARTLKSRGYSLQCPRCHRNIEPGSEVKTHASRSGNVRIVYHWKCYEAMYFDGGDS